MSEIHLEVPFNPVSTNCLYKTFNNRVVTSKKYKEFKEKMSNYLATQDIKPIIGPVYIKFTFYISDRRKHDLDNLLKSLIDSLTPICFLNDNQIVHIEATKIIESPEPKTVIHIKGSPL